MTLTMRARSEIGSETVGDGALRPYSPRTDYRYLAATTARSVAHANAAIIGALRDGAMSARSYDETGLTYADGWAAAVTLAELAAFESVKPTG